MTQDELKALVGRAALDHVPAGCIVGVGTGSTVNCFIDALAQVKQRVVGAVSSSEKSSERLRAHGIPVLDANAVERLPVYIDGADEIDAAGHMIKGGARRSPARRSWPTWRSDSCIADESKLVKTLGVFLCRWR